ncbi:MAG: ATP synthase F1 subunit gamma [Bacteroidales bacterium]|nr:ATP synthase F1 subunit gamma [Bacteroidales bacterium]MBN2821220.1 ATP synthase F1 subunit gamma [Bacteroidales bacterium]
MANLKEIRTRITSVKSTRQITSAMKMVSAAKLRKAQDAIIQLRPYASKLEMLLDDVAKNVDSHEVNLYLNKREVNKALFIVITSNKGLCGAFNSNVVKNVIADIQEEYAELAKKGGIEIFCVGKKGAELLKSKGYKSTYDYHDLLEDIQYSEIKNIALDLNNKYLNGKFDLIKIYYNQFKNAANQEVIADQYLPFELPEQKAYAEVHFDYILEPSKESIVGWLIPKSLKIKLYKAVLDSNASEQGARMTAMHKATDNASELIKELQLEYNKARQAAITNEILEIVGGAEALKT